jgi:hypothetical protein
MGHRVVQGDSWLEYGNRVRVSYRGGSRISNPDLGVIRGHLHSYQREPRSTVQSACRVDLAHSPVVPRNEVPI